MSFVFLLEWIQKALLNPRRQAECQSNPQGRREPGDIDIGKGFRAQFSHFLLIGPIRQVFFQGHIAAEDQDQGYGPESHFGNGVGNDPGEACIFDLLQKIFVFFVFFFCGFGGLFLVFSSSDDDESGSTSSSH